MRMIDADALVAIYKKWIPQLASKEDEGDKRGVTTCIAVLEDAPTIDAVPVIRCAECKYSFVVTDQDGKRQLLCTEIGKRGLKDDDFCSCGKARK